MNATNTEAVSELAAALASLLPEVSDPALQMQVRVAPARILPAGVGAFIGMHPDPKGEIYGLRLDAKVLVTIKAHSLNDLKTSQVDVSRSLVAAEPGILQSLGILRIQLEDLGRDTLEESGEGAETIVAQDLHFNVLFEYLEKPEAAEGTIAEIRQNVEVVVTGRQPELLVSAALTQESLAWFDAVDDPKATRNAPSQWQFNAEENRIEQVSAIWGGSSQPDPVKPGTYLVLKTTPDIPLLEDFMLKVRLQSNDEDGIGVVFRWQDADNFYFFLMDKRRNYRVMGKKLAGEFLDLSTPTLDTSRGYETNVSYDLKLIVGGTQFNLYLDDELALRGQDAGPPIPGQVGFMCRTNDQAYFYRIELVKL